MRNVLAQVTKGNQEMVAAAIRTIFAQPDAEHGPFLTTQPQAARPEEPKVGHPDSQVGPSGTPRPST